MHCRSYDEVGVVLGYHNRNYNKACFVSVCHFVVLTIRPEMICHVNLIMCREFAYEYCLLNANLRTRKRRSQQGLLEYKKRKHFLEIKIIDFLTKMLT